MPVIEINRTATYNAAAVGSDSTGDDKAQAVNKRPIPIHLPIVRHEADQAYAKWIKKRLEKGEMPKFLIESARLVAEGDSPEGDIVIGYVRSLMDLMAQRAPGEPAPPLTIYLSDQNSMSTGVMTQGPVPILVNGLDFLDFLIEENFGEDHQLGVLGQRP